MKDANVLKTADRPFDWVAALAIACGMAVVLPGLLALIISLWAVMKALI